MKKTPQKTKVYLEGYSLPQYLPISLYPILYNVLDQLKDKAFHSLSQDVLEPFLDLTASYLPDGVDGFTLLNIAMEWFQDLLSNMEGIKRVPTAKELEEETLRDDLQVMYEDLVNPSYQSESMQTSIKSQIAQIKARLSGHDEKAMKSKHENRGYNKAIQDAEKHYGRNEFRVNQWVVSVAESLKQDPLGVEQLPYDEFIPLANKVTIKFNLEGAMREDQERQQAAQQKQ